MVVLAPTAAATLRRYGVRAIAAVSCLLALLGPLPAEADTGTPGVGAELVCKSEPKLVLCRVLFATGGGFVSWADATIEEAPPPSLARPVWSYASFRKDGIHEPNLKFGLIPKGAGKGTLAVRVRASVCPNEGALCANFNRVIKATVVVK